MNVMCDYFSGRSFFFQSKSDRYHRINSPAGTLIFSKRTKCYVVSHYFILIFFFCGLGIN